MLSIVFFALMFVALVSIFSEMIMRVRLSMGEPKGEKLFWWRRGGDEVAAEYRAVFPRAFLPAFRVFAFWLFLAVVLILCIVIFFKQHTI